MKNHDNVKNLIDSARTLRAVPQVIADWNLNRYHKPVADNYPPETDNNFNSELFPIESIVENNRPTKGINKARVGHSVIADDYFGSVENAAKPRFYIVDAEDEYKYWTSPKTSDSLGNIVEVKPYIMYPETVMANKIVITTENSWATAKTFSVQVTVQENPTEFSGWTEIANEGSIGNAWKTSGQIVLRWTGTQWSPSEQAPSGIGLGTELRPIRGIRLVVTQLEGGRDSLGNPTAYTSSDGNYEIYTDGKNTFFDLIEIRAGLEVDLSEYVIDASSTFDLSDASDLYPIGTITSNIGNLSLSNIYSYQGESRWGAFSKNNNDPAVFWSDYLEPNAEIVLKYKFYDEWDTFVDTVQEFKMYTDTWAGQTEDTVEIELSDYSKFFNEQTVRSAMWENLTVSEIVMRLCDMVGFVDHNINLRAGGMDDDSLTEHTIPVFYTNGEDTLWAVLDDLARSTQSAVYFDSYGTLNVKTREFAFSPYDTPVASLSSVEQGDALVNIISMSDSIEFSPNHYKILYQKSSWAPYRGGQPVMQRVWEPDSTVTLRSSQLKSTLGISNNYLQISPDDVRFWPFNSIVNIQGEILEFDGKEYAYYDEHNIQRNKVVKSEDERKKLNRQSSPGKRHLNRYTGRLKIVERGMWNSTPREHSVDAQGYNVRKLMPGSYWQDSSGFSHIRAESEVELKSTGSMKGAKDFLLATRNAPDDNVAFSHYGTKLRFVKENGRSMQRAGLIIHNSGAGDQNGYYIDFGLSRMLDAKERKEREEITLYARNDHDEKKIETRAFAIGEGIDYEIDVEFKVIGTSHRISVWVNGQLALSSTIDGANRNAVGRFGMFIRGSTKARFEYLYALRRESRTLNDDFSFLHKVKSSFMANQWERDWVWGTRSKKRKKKGSNKEREKWKIAFYDEFGPYVHEVREFSVKFDPTPVLHSRLYSTNDWNSVCVSYSATPFGAKFIMANTSRENAILNGEDKLSFAGTGDAVNQVLTVFGRALDVGESEEVIYKNEEQMRRRGKIESEISSPWIQNKEMAKDISTWLGEHFSWGNETLNADIFGNPLLEVGDIVTVNYPQKDLSGEFFVISVSTRYDKGLTTSLVLRRRVITA